MSLLSELNRYFCAAKIFRFFIHHPYIYVPLFRDMVEKHFRLRSYLRPRNIVLKLSSRCNARCRFCYARQESKQDRPELNYQQWTSVIDSARRLGCYTVTFSGGEPSIYPQILDLIRYVRKRRMLPFTTTNGIGVSPERLKAFEAAGLCALNFSIHGPREVHDSVVGVPGAYDKMIRGATYCAQHTRIVCIANHVITRDSVRNGWYKEIWAKMEPLGVRAFNVLPICASSADKSDLLEPEDLAVYHELAKDPKVIMDTKNYSKPRCPAAREDLLVNNYGEVQPCPFIPVTFGNVLDRSLEELFLAMQRHAMFRRQSSVCMPAEDHDFIDRYIVPAFASESLPAPVETIWRQPCHFKPSRSRATTAAAGKTAS